MIRGVCARLASLAALALLACCNDIAPDPPGSSVSPPAPTPPGSAILAPPTEGGQVHLVRLVAEGGHYRFEPAAVQIRTGDVVRFVQTGYEPESIAFQPDAAPPVGARVLAAQSAANGPLLTAPGAIYDVHFRDAPPGRYPFASVTHAQAGMRGTVVVVAPAAEP